MSSTRPLIAVVDDDQGMRTALRRLLCTANFDVETFQGVGRFAWEPSLKDLDRDNWTNTISGHVIKLFWIAIADRKSC